MGKIIALSFGSIVGGLARYYLGGFVHRLAGHGFPYGTLSVNLLGCLIIGFLSSAAQSKWPIGETGRMLLMTGFCGAFTTFSTFILEVGDLLKAGNTSAAVINLLASVGMGFLFYRLGMRLASI